MTKELNPPPFPGKIEIVGRTITLTLVFAFVLALGCFGVGVFAIYKNATGTTNFKVLGLLNVSTGIAGVALVVVGAAVFMYALRKVIEMLRFLRD